MIKAYCTDKGIKKATNQDALLLKTARLDGDLIVFAMVADGMGGMSRGEAASRLAVEKFRNWFVNDLNLLFEQGFSVDGFKDSITKATEELHTEIKNELGQQQGGTTIVGMFVMKNMYIAFNVGDSRGYKLDDGSKELEQITHDHSVVQYLIDTKAITKEEALTHKDRSVLMQCCGAGDQLPSPQFYTGKYANNTLFLVCSDGFVHVVNEKEMASMLSYEFTKSNEELKVQLEKIVEMSKERNEKDNITVLAFRMEDDEWDCE